jgi:hypothetical protein
MLYTYPFLVLDYMQESLALRFAMFVERRGLHWNPGSMPSFSYWILVIAEEESTLTMSVAIGSILILSSG